LSVTLIRYGAAPQYDGCQYDQTKRVGTEDQDIGPQPVRVQGEVVEGVLLQYNGVVDWKDLGEDLNSLRIEGDWPKGTTQEEEWQGGAKRQRGKRLPLLD